MGLMESFESLGRPEKITIGVGVISIILFIWQPWKKSTSGTSDLTYSTAAGTNNTSQGYTAPAVDTTQFTSAINALNDKQASDNAALKDQLTAMQDKYSALPTANDYSAITKSVSDITTAMQTNQASVNKMLSDQDTYLTNSINRMTLPQQTPAYSPPPIVSNPQPVIRSNPFAYASSVPNAYNLVGGGSTQIQPKPVPLLNGNTIKYDNGPNGWTEYNSSGTAIRWGTASPY